MHTILLLSSAGLVVSLDQLVKLFVVAHFSPQAMASVVGIRLRLVINRTGAQSPLYWLCLLLVQAIWLCGVLAFVPLPQHQMVTAGLGLALGGAVSNTIDRVLRRGVVDYIDLGFWPVFNIADAAIVLGAGAAFSLLFVSLA
jgi:signal peptidase II